MFSLTRYEKALVLIFVLSLPLSNPWVRGDGVGYYAFVRSLLIEHRLDFTEDWQKANTSFRRRRVDPDGRIAPDQYTPTGQLDNHFSVGPAVLWSPFILAAHLSVRVYDDMGGRIAADGYSQPYLVAMALGTALYGFGAVLISFRMARKLVAERWAFVAAVGIWWGSSLPVYMYFNPSWSHAVSAFSVALFLWYWMRTREARTWQQWAMLGALGGLMMDVYYPNALLLIFPAVESLGEYRSLLTGKISPETWSRLLSKHLAFAILVALAFSPTLITKKLIYGGYLQFGYFVHWYWWSPAFFKVCFSAHHGAFSWTPILLLGAIGLPFLCKYDRTIGLCSIAGFLGYVYVLGCYEDWDGLSSFGNRFLVSLTPLFILGLAGLLESLSAIWSRQRTMLWASSVTAVLVAWNLGLIFQWGMHLIPARGPVSWRVVAHNQVSAVPLEVSSTLKRYLTGRQKLMNQIENEDVRQMEIQPATGKE